MIFLAKSNIYYSAKLINFACLFFKNTKTTNNIVIYLLSIYYGVQL